MIDNVITFVVGYTRAGLDQPKLEIIMGSRDGKHKDGKILLGGVVDPWYKAVTIVTASVVAAKSGRNKMTQVEMLWYGVATVAQMVGVLDSEGKPTPEFADAIKLAEHSVIEANKTNLGSRGGRRKGRKL